MPPVQTIEASVSQNPALVASQSVVNNIAQSTALKDVLAQVQTTIAPVWPLKDYVAINPYAGISEKTFLNARSYLRAFSDCELLMPMAYHAERFQQGRFQQEDIEVAIEELKGSTSVHEPTLSAPEIVEHLHKIYSKKVSSTVGENLERHVKTVAEYLDNYTCSNWTVLIQEEISKHCAAHYDEGQALWASPWKDLPLYQAWKSAAVIDRNPEILGIKGFRKFVDKLPHTPEAALTALLNHLNVPEKLWETVLLSQAFSIPGWSAWTKYQSDAGERSGEINNDLAGLLAIRLAYDAALSSSSAFETNWSSMTPEGKVSFDPASPESNQDAVLRFTLLRAAELGYQRELLGIFSVSSGVEDSKPSTKKLAQMVFCIDVRSERIRRNLESLTDEVETCGFAGFFGMPLEYVPVGENAGVSHVPVLLTPQFKVQEGLCSHGSDHQSHKHGDASTECQVTQRKSSLRLLRKAMKHLQSSAVSCFSFVETSGLFYGAKLLSRTLGLEATKLSSRFDGVSPQDQDRLGPQLDGLEAQGLGFEQQVTLAHNALKGMGLTQNFARLVVFCGHGSQVENNPLQAGLDCGACGGHSGEPNARFAAKLLNQTAIRAELNERGIVIPDEVHFLAGLHNTTTDSITFFDLKTVPASHHADVQALSQYTTLASELTQVERTSTIASDNVSNLLKRSGDWSEVRPEWGLAGNAAFIVGPRSLTKSANLNGRAFMHNYDHQLDPEGAVLEAIMTAPMIVAQWINMQYFASTVDNKHFGSGTKTVHNVVGRFGIFSGNGGDLMTGLPWESLHDGTNYQHHPQRLLTVIAAPKDAIEQVIAKHDNVSNLLTNGWLNLVAVEEGQFYQYSQDQNWTPITLEQRSTSVSM